MLSSPQYKSVKQGYVLKKGGSGFFSNWRVKFLNLVVDGSNFVIQVFDERDPTKPPKHEIPISDVRVDPNPSVGKLKKGASAFTLISRTRKFHLAAYTRHEKEDWMDAISKAKTAMNGEERIGRSRKSSVSSMNGDALVRSRSRQTSIYRSHVDEEFDDARSVYSLASEMTERTGQHYRSKSGLDEENASIGTSNVETLSFCSEPVLTPYELTIMGNEAALARQNSRSVQAATRDAYLRRRVPENKATKSTDSWNVRYQALLMSKSITEDAMLMKDVSIVELMGEFQETASGFARRMIDEYHVLGLSSTTSELNQYLQPTESGEHLLRHDGIVYQFACDYDRARVEEIEGAIKQSSADFKCLDVCARATSVLAGKDVPVLNSLLMVLVDYKGFRVLAQADIDQDNVTVVHDIQPDNIKVDADAVEAMKVLSSELNLKTHGVQVTDDRRVWIPLSSSVMAHQETKKGWSATYLTNLQDIFPVDYYTSDASKDQSKNPFWVKRDATEVDLTKRLRPEFVQRYQTALCSDAMTPTAGSTLLEREDNDAEVMLASRFLRETWIPGFVKSMDEYQVRPFDSISLTNELHRYGINIRYLGLIHKLSRLPFNQTMFAIEMVARICKKGFNNHMRAAILHFKTVGARSIEEELKMYAVNMFSLFLGVGERSYKFFEEFIKTGLIDHFSFDMTFKQFANLYRPALFHALQHHCGVVFEETMDYDFESKQQLISLFKHFEPRVKSLFEFAPIISKNVRPVSHRDEERFSYLLARHFKSLGPKSRLAKSNPSSAALCQIAAHYNASCRFEEGRLYAQAAFSTTFKNHLLSGLSLAQLVYSLAGLQACVTGGPDPTILTLYSQALGFIEWHMGADHPFLMTLHDRMAMVYYQAKEIPKAYEFHLKSLQVAERAFGKNHAMTGGYLTKAGYYLLCMKRADESIEKLSQALEIYTSLSVDLVLIAEVHYYFAECYFEKGDFNGALQYAQRARKSRERLLGLNDIRVIDSCRQVSKVVLAPFQFYRGVLTPVIKAAYREAIVCHEKVFRYLKATMPNNRSMRDDASEMSYRPSILRQPRPNVPATTMDAAQPLLGTSGTVSPIAGPLVKSPMGPSLPLSKSLLHILTKEIVAMKLALLESPKHREYVRTERAKRVASQNEDERPFDVSEARQVVLQMAAVSPSVYLDGLFQRIDEHDGYALQELGLVLVLTESESFGVPA